MNTGTQQRQARPISIVNRAAEIKGIDEKKRQIEFCASTGKRVEKFSWSDWDFVEEELEISMSAVDLSRLAKGAPFLRDHRATTDFTIGVHHGGWIETKNGIPEVWAVATIFEDEESERCWQKIKGGLRNISTGYQVETYEIVEEKGKPKLYIARKWTVLENSLVAIPADPDAQIRGLSQQEESRLFPCTFLSRSLTPSPKGSRMDAKELADLLGESDPDKQKGILQRFKEADQKSAALASALEQERNERVALKHASDVEKALREGRIEPHQQKWALELVIAEETDRDGNKVRTINPAGVKTFEGYLRGSVPRGPGNPVRTQSSRSASISVDGPKGKLSDIEREICRNLGIKEESFLATKQQARSTKPQPIEIEEEGDE